MRLVSSGKCLTADGRLPLRPLGAGVRRSITILPSLRFSLREKSDFSTKRKSSNILRESSIKIEKSFGKCAFFSLCTTGGVFEHPLGQIAHLHSAYIDNKKESV